MKITNVEAFPTWGGHRNFFFVTVDTDEGISGVGETGIGSREAGVVGIIDHLKEILIGQDPMRTEHLWQVLYRSGFFPATHLAASAISAIDIALWDIKGKALGVPVYDLLGGLSRDKVVCYPHNVGHEMEVESLVESCLKTKEEGWKFVRWGLPQDRQRLEPRESIRAAVKQFEAVRDAVGDDIEMCFDVHTRLDTAHVIAMCRDLEEFKPFFIEDPIRSENPGSYRTLARHVSLPIAAGEQWASKWPFREVIEEELISYARIDLCIVGGLTEALKVTHWAETHYIDIVPHNPLGPVSAAACVSLCMASTNVGVQEMPRRPGTFAQDLFPQQIGWEDGFAFCHDAPGLGIEFNLEAAESRRVTPSGWPPQLRREDGAFTNW
jgi:L-alanine-DL-glutamate epimerase-like enolase superfamily enzyme